MAAAASVDLAAYFDRIRWGGATRPTLDTLSGVLAAHMRHIPFENLDVLLGRPIRLDLEGLQAKLVHGRRGGYCFEHASLLFAVLEALGFAPVRHTARVVVIVPRNVAPRTHMFLTVPLAEGRFVVDPGFGALAPRVPVPLRDGEIVTAGEEAHCMVQDGSHWVLRASSDGEFVDGWVTPLEADNVVDFDMGNHFTSTYPASVFRQRLMMRALADDGRVSVMNRDVTIMQGAAVRTLQLADRKALRSLLAEHFGIDLPEAEGIRVPMIPEWD